jgi:hypothetical protein
LGQSSFELIRVGKLADRAFRDPAGSSGGSQTTAAIVRNGL